MRYLILTIFLVAVLMTSATAALLHAPIGYEVRDTLFSISAGDYVGGFDIADNGNYIVFNGGEIQEVTPSGTILRTIWNVGAGTAGSFIKLMGGNIYYGENTNGTIGTVRLDGTEHRIIATLPYNYDMAFNPLGEAFVVTGSDYGATTPSCIYQLDLATGAAVLVASIDGASGPIIFDDAGSLFYGTVSNVFGMTGGQSVLLWTSEQIANAATLGALSVNDASVAASDIDSPAGFAWGPEGFLYFSSVVSSPGSIWQVSDDGTSPFANVDPSLGISWLTTLRYDASTGSLSALVGWMDANWNTYSGIGTICPQANPVPEPCSFLILSGMVTLSAVNKQIFKRRSK